MSDVPDSENPIQIEGTRTRSPVSESIIQAIAGAVNFLLNASGWAAEEFFANGNYDKPAGVTQLLLIGWGQGGGGGSASSGAGNDGSGGGGGGAPFLMKFLDGLDAAATTVAIQIGTGDNGGNPGNANGSDGQASIFDTGALLETVTFPGGRGGLTPAGRAAGVFNQPLGGPARSEGGNGLASTGQVGGKGGSGPFTDGPNGGTGVGSNGSANSGAGGAGGGSGGTSLNRAGYGGSGYLMILRLQKS